jgi:hypothetical protein
MWAVAFAVERVAGDLQAGETGVDLVEARGELGAFGGEGVDLRAGNNRTRPPV